MLVLSVRRRSPPVAKMGLLKLTGYGAIVIELV
jgi:hypothetical protein